MLSSIRSVMLRHLALQTFNLDAGENGIREIVFAAQKLCSFTIYFCFILLLLCETAHMDLLLSLLIVPLKVSFFAIRGASEHFCSWRK